MRIGIDASRAFVAEPTGTERYSFELITRLVALPEAREHQWVLYTRSKTPISNFQFPNNDQMAKFSNVQIREIPISRLWTQAGLAARTWTDGLDVLWVPAHTLPLLRRGFAGLGRPLRTVVTIHGIEYEWLPAYENALQRWYLPWSTIYAVKTADRVIAVSEFTKRQLVERLGVPADKVSVIYEGVSQNVQFRDKRSRASRANSNFQIISKKFNLQKKKYILFVGTVQPRKNLVRLIEAFSSLKWDGKLVIAGKPGWSYEGILAAPVKYGVEDRVIFAGYVNEAERYSLLQNAVVYVQPSITEGFGLPVVEAMREGVPAVVSGGGALPELVPHTLTAQAGWPVFDPGNVEDIVDKLARVIGNLKLRREMIRRGRQKAGEFTWESATRKTYNILT